MPQNYTMQLFDRNGRLRQEIMSIAGLEAFKTAAQAVLNCDPDISYIEIREGWGPVFDQNREPKVIMPELPWE